MIIHSNFDHRKYSESAGWKEDYVLDKECASRER